MRAVVALLTSGFCLRVFVALRPLKWIDGLTLPDDAYLSLTIARSVGRGLGPLYGTSYTNGFQPLWVFLTAPLYAWRPFDLEGNVHAALVVLAGCDTLFAALVCLLVSRWTRSPLAASVAAAAWAVNPYSVRTSLCGLEASLSAALAALVLLLLDRERDARELDRRRLFVLGIALGLAILARIDNGFLALTVALFLVPWHAKPLSQALRSALARILPVAAAAAAVTAPWLAYSYAYTGDLYPISGRAVRLVALGDRVVKGGTLEGYRGTLLGEAWAWFLQDNAFLLCLVAGLLLVVVLFFRSDLTSLAPALRRAAPALLWGTLLFFVYPLHVLAHWFFPRYQYPILVPLLLVLGLLVGFVTSRPRLERIAMPLAATLAVGSLAFHATRHETATLLFARRENLEGYRAIGLWARNTFPRGTAIGSSQTGALGYFAPDLRVVNLDGVVNRACYDSLVARRNIDYILDERIDYVLGWPNNIGFIHLFSDRPVDPFLVPLGPVPGIKSWGNEWLLYRVRRDGS
jgi:hypothetical protein